MDEVSEGVAMHATMFGGARPPLNPSELSPAIGVHFHIAVPNGLQTTTVSLVETLKESEEHLEVVVDGATLVADTASLVSPVWISMGGQCDFASTAVGDDAPQAMRILVVGGTDSPDDNSNVLATSELYDAGTGLWSSAASLNTARQYHAIAALPGTVIVAGGCGASYSDSLSSAEAYDVSTDSWSAIASMTTARRGAAAATVEGKVFVIGGSFFDRRNWQYPSSGEVYDPATDSWSAIADMGFATGRTDHTAVAVGGSIYVMGGDNGGSALSSCLVYSVASNSWSSSDSWNIASMPTTRRNHAAAALGAKIYIVGGNGRPSLDGLAAVYDTVANTWSSVASMGASRDYGPAAAFVGSSLVALGGGYPALASAEVYDIATGAWAEVSSMGMARVNTAAVAI